MADLAPDYELLAAVVTRLKADAAVSALVGTKVYDRVPQKPNGQADVASPYLSLGPSTEVPDDADCIDGVEVTFQIDAWSWGAGEAFGSAQVRKIARAVRRSLHDAEINLTTNALVTLRHELTRVMRDPDGVTNHAAMQFTAVIETPKDGDES